MDVIIHNDLEVKLARNQPDTPWYLPTRSKWEVLKDYELTVYHRQQCMYSKKVELVAEDFVVPRGYPFDAASIPFFLWWRFQPTYKYVFEPSAVHDYFYDELYKYYPKEFADNVFKAMMLHMGAPPHQAWLFHQSVSMFGKGGW